MAVNGARLNDAAPTAGQGFAVQSLCASHMAIVSQGGVPLAARLTTIGVRRVTYQKARSARFIKAGVNHKT